MPAHAFEAEARGFDVGRDRIVRFQFHSRQDAGGAAGADQLEPAVRGMKLDSPNSSSAPSFGCTSVFKNVFSQSRHVGQFFRLRRIAVRNFFHQPHRAERKTFLKMFVLALAQNEFRAAAADIEKQQRLRRQLRIGGHAMKRPLGFLFAGNDFHFQARRGFDRGNQFLGVDRIARGAGGDDADGIRLQFARLFREVS